MAKLKVPDGGRYLYGQRPPRTPSLTQIDRDRLGLGVMLHHFLAHFAAPAGLLVAAERPGRVAVIVGVDADRAGPDLARHHVGDLQVAASRRWTDRPYSVSLANFATASRSASSKDWTQTTGPKISSRTTFIVAIGLRQHRRLDEIALVADDLAAGDHLGAFLPARLDEAGHAVVLLLRDQRPEVDGRIEAVADLQLAGLPGDALDDLVVDRLVREQPRARRAALALVVEDRARGAGDREFQIGVREDDRRRLAAEFQRDALQIAGGCLDDQLADFGRAGEGDLVDIRMLGERGAGGLADSR